MMYNSYKSLEGKTLECNDEVIFGENLEYVVTHCYLRSISGLNDKIFIHLKIKNKYEFCKKAYGYNCENGFWPTSNVNDYPALTRCALELFILIEGIMIVKKEIVVTPKEFIPKRIFLRR